MEPTQLLFWAPRALCIALILFVSMFALDVFGEGRGFWGTLQALVIHLIPTWILLAVLALSWRYELAAAGLFVAIGGFFLYIVRADWAGKAMFAVPAFLIAALFLMHWLAVHRGRTT
jgi:hypothetical protein